MRKNRAAVTKNVPHSGAGECYAAMLGYGRYQMGADLLYGAKKCPAVHRGFYRGVGDESY